MGTLSRSITGVATSITAFIGRASRGPVNEPVLIHSFDEFQRYYGGLSLDSTISYAVRDFYTNGGRQAIILRLHRDPGGEASPAATLAPGGLKLIAANPGEWGRRLSARVDRKGITPEAAGRCGLNEEDLLNLEVVEMGADGSLVAHERFLDLSVRPDAGPRRVDRVLEQESQLVRVPSREDGTPDLPGDNPAAPQDAPAFIDASGGTDSAGLQDEDYEAGFEILDQADLINLLCIPPDRRDGFTSKAVYQKALAFCVRRRAMLIVDPRPEWGENPGDFLSKAEQKLQDDLGLDGVEARNAALYFPRVIQLDPLQGNRLEPFAPCGLIAGVMARTDDQRGVWKAPAGAGAGLNGVQGLEVNLSDRENGALNPLGINCIRSFLPRGPVVWGARTLRGADRWEDEYKYVPVRRLALFIEESLYRGTQWVVFEPNGEPLWAQIRLHVSAFMHGLFQQGAFQGSSPPEAYFVKCDSETTTQDDIDRGFVNFLVGFAPLKPAEFLILRIRQRAGQVGG
ncbi:MAG TPA: phage tail sheath C-terminal domain-containing protein [Anaerolineales bacterium]